MIRVCDMIMGAGKTSAAIRMMNEDKEGKYLFITPYLDEVTRIKVSCASRGFCEPVNYGGGKMSDLKQLLKKGVNIASTHAFFIILTARLCSSSGMRGIILCLMRYAKLSKK